MPCSFKLKKKTKTYGVHLRVPVSHLWLVFVSVKHLLKQWELYICSVLTKFVVKFRMDYAMSALLRAFAALLNF